VVPVVRCRQESGCGQRRTNDMAVSILQLIWFALFNGADISVS
jgi:hypothetical protein